MFCKNCGSEISAKVKFCKNCGLQIPSTTKQIKETKCTCSACGNIWYYGKEETDRQSLNAMSNCSKSMMCCGGCFPAAFIPDKKIVDFNKCPKCNSRAISKEEITHNV